MELMTRIELVNLILTNGEKVMNASEKQNEDSVNKIMLYYMFAVDG